MSSERPGYRASMKLHMSLSKGGSVYGYELTDYPGVTITNRRDTRKDKWEQFAAYKEKQYDKIADAIKAWTADQKEGKDGKNES